MTELNNTFSRGDNPVAEDVGSIVMGAGEFPVLGRSRAILRIRKQIKFAAKVNFPIFISGEAGTEKRSVASSIHMQRNLAGGSFVYVPANIHDLEGYQAYLDKGLEKARNGTLYLSEVDTLTTEQKDYLISIFSLDYFQKVLDKRRIRLIVSCTDSLVLERSSKQFLAKLLGSDTPHLELHIPPLRERKEDIRQYVQYILGRLSSSRDITVNTGALSLLTDYDWPGNVVQLQRILVLLASCCNSEITESDIFALNIIKKQKTSYDVVDTVLERKFDALQQIHPGVLKALIYLSYNFKEDISLADLAGAAFTSSSHLSYLFREHLHHSFKTILVQVRVRYAKRMIDSAPMLKITDICLRSGFGDLSHFEKMFKRYVGCTPRQYRRQKREVTSLAKAS